MSLLKERVKENKEGALRYNQDKLRWSLVDYEALEPMVRVLEFGADKYAPDNWKKGMSYRSTSESLLRHMYAFMNGEDIDPESGISHIGHVLCNAMFLSNYLKHREEFDDRKIIEK